VHTCASSQRPNRILTAPAQNLLGRACPLPWRPGGLARLANRGGKKAFAALPPVELSGMGAPPIKAAVGGIQWTARRDANGLACSLVPPAQLNQCLPARTAALGSVHAGGVG
jgi:hypothetical protein